MSCFICILYLIINGISAGYLIYLDCYEAFSFTVNYLWDSDLSVK